MSDTMILGPDAGGVEPQIDAPEVDLGTDILDAGAEVETQETPETSGAEKTATEAPVGRQDVQKALDAIKESDPRIAGELRSKYFKASQFESVYPSPQEARDAKEFIEGIGGEEGYREVLSQRDEFKDVVARFDAGDPEILKQLAAESPKALETLAPAGLAALRQSNPEAHHSIAVNEFSELMKAHGARNGIEGLFVELANIFNSLDAKSEARGRVENLYAFLKEIKDKAKPLPEFKSQVPNKESELNDREQNVYLAEVSRQTVPIVNQAITAILNPLMKGKTLTVDQKKAVYADAFGAISKELKEDAKFQGRLEFLKKSHDTGKILQMVKSRLGIRDAKGRTIAGRAVGSAWNTRGFGGVTNGTKPQPSTQARTLAKKPSTDMLDKSDPDWMTKYMRGEGVLKGTKQKVRWNWDSVE